MPLQSPRGELNDELGQERLRRRQKPDPRRQSLSTVARSTMENATTPGRTTPIRSTRTTPVRGATPTQTPQRTPRSESGSRRASGRFLQNEDDFLHWLGALKSKTSQVEKSWDIPLIDYFTDMSLLKDGDTINFSRASQTLDGCVKVYGWRVENVSSDMSKLLSGLVTRNTNPDEVSAENDVDEVPGSPKRAKRTRKAQVLTAPERLQMDTRELKNAIDPFFRKMSADFDGAGVRGLLLNLLRCDHTGRLLFDGDIEVNDKKEPKGLDTIIEEEEEEQEEPPTEGADRLHYKLRYFCDDSFKRKEMVTSLSDIHAHIADPHSSALARDFTACSLDVEPEPTEMEDIDYAFEDVGSMSVMSDAGDLAGLADTSFSQTALDQCVTAYFAGHTDPRNWAGASNWRVRRLAAREARPDETAAARSKPSPKSTLIDFGAPVDRNAVLVKGTAINLPVQTQKQRSNNHLLPEDMHLTAASVLELFLRRDGKPAPAFVRGFGSRSRLNYAQEEISPETPDAPEEDPPEEALNVFEDLVGAEYEAQEPEAWESPSQDAAGAREEYSRSLFARAARKVDMKLLKTNLWEALQTGEQHSLVSALQTTSEAYTPTELAEISGPLCVISLLHLANEHGLKIRNRPDFGDLVIEKAEVSAEA